MPSYHRYAWQRLAPPSRPAPPQTFLASARNQTPPTTPLPPPPSCHKENFWFYLLPIGTEPITNIFSCSASYYFFHPPHNIRHLHGSKSCMLKEVKNKSLRNIIMKQFPKKSCIRSGAKDVVAWNVERSFNGQFPRSEKVFTLASSVSSAVTILL